MSPRAAVLPSLLHRDHVAGGVPMSDARLQNDRDKAEVFWDRYCQDFIPSLAAGEE